MLTPATASLTTAQNLNPFMAASPPTMSPTPHTALSPLAERALQNIDGSAATNTFQKQLDSQQTNGAVPNDVSHATVLQTSPSNTICEKPGTEYVSKIGILTSSLPMYHNQLIKARQADQEKETLQKKREPLEPKEAEVIPNLLPEVPGDHERSIEEPVETVRRLKPHSRSTIQPQSITADAANPERVVLDMRSKSKYKTPRWQLGIRSRNEPVDVINCLYKALESMGDCQLQISPPEDPSSKDIQRSFPVNVEGALHLTSGESNPSGSPEKHKHRHGPHAPHPDSRIDTAKVHSSDDNTQRGYESENDEDVDPNVFPSGYTPKDPWCINVQWEKKGMSPPGATGASSARSSHARVDGIITAVRVRDLAAVDVVEVEYDQDFLPAVGILDDVESAAFGFGEVAEDGGRGRGLKGSRYPTVSFCL